MKILIFGRGVIGAQYGWALEKAGHTVEFYVRPGRTAIYGTEIGLDLPDLRTSIRGHRVTERWPVRFCEDIPIDHDYDLILVSDQHYRFAEASAFLAPRIRQASALLFL